MISEYNKFSIEINPNGNSSIIYWDKETSVRSVLQLEDGLKSKIVRKIKLAQPDIPITESNSH